MAKLYWRVKKNGRWNWIAVSEDNTIDIEDYDAIGIIAGLRYVEEEE